MKIALFLKERPLHLVFFPLLFILNHFFAIVTPGIQHIDNAWAWVLNFIGAVISCICLPLALYKILLLKFNAIKGALLATLFFLPFFFFQDLFLSTERLLFLGLRARWVLPVLFVLLIIIGGLIIKINRPFRAFNQYLNILSLSLIGYTVMVLVLSYEALRPKVLNFKAPFYELAIENKPDIYLFILDSYTSNQSLRNYFQFDNREFKEAVEKLDFKVSDQAYSAYAHTEYSVSSTLNFNQIKDMGQYNYGLAEAIRESTVVKSLKRSNYEFYNYSLFELDDQPVYYAITPSVRVKFVNGIIQSSILNMVFDLTLKLKLYNIHSDILEKIQQAAVKRHANPRFFYGHILAPHPPFVIDETGQGIGFFSQPRNAANALAYVKQIKGLNKMVLAKVQDIIKASPNSIVIIMGDHGYRYLGGQDVEDEAFTVFLAYRGPNKDSLNTLINSNQIFELIFKKMP